MKFKFLKAKALFQIFIIVLSIFTISLLNPKQAEAQTQQNYCCEKTTSGEFCQYTSSDNCDSSYNKAPSTCDKTQFCQPGCCVFKGSCSKSTGYSNCLNSGGSWKQDATCSIPECNKACCVIGSDCSLETQEVCRERTSQYPDLSLDFRSEIQSEAACTDVCRSTEKGCCVSQDGTCSYTSKASCKDENFHSGTFCSDNSLKLDCSQCKPHATKKCIDEDVYWFDSCDNQENLAEDCDYATGTICSENFGPAKCISVNCASTYNSEQVDYDGVARKNGESWCMYEGAAGPTLDLVGSRHYRHVCVNGKELVEPCKDFREEVCYQADVQTTQGTYREAVCRDNRWNDCVTTCNTASTATSDSVLYTKMKKDKECCENTQLRDCIWIKEDTNQSSSVNGVCLPRVPAGFKFWPDDPSATGDSGRVSNYNGMGICSKADFTGKMRWEKNLGGDWECESYCEFCNDGEKCDSGRFNEVLKNTNSYCRALGDCGAHYNIECVLTNDAFSASGEKVSFTGLDSSLIGDCQTKFKKARDGLYLGTVNVEDVEKINPGLYSALVASLVPALISGGSIHIMAVLKIVLTNVLSYAGVGAGVAAGSAEAAAIATELTDILEAQGLISAGAEGTSAGAVAASCGPYCTVFWVIVIIIILVIIYKMFKKVNVKETNFTCETWQAPLGGADCEKCTDQKILAQLGFNTCSEYRCRSLGQNCKLINQGTTKEKCIDSNPNDVTSPIISPDPTLLPQGYAINPSQYGFSISPLIQPYTKFNFGIRTNELAKCKIHDEHTSSYDQMPSTFLEPGTYFAQQHNMSLTTESGKEYSYYVRCIDASGNKNIAEYAIRFASQIAPDKTPPVIELTSIENNAFLPYNTTETQLSIYTNEPTNCKWSQEDKPYDEMLNDFECISTSSKLNFNLYPCLTELTNLTINNNALFFRCTDKAGNKNQESYQFNLIGTPNLQIISSQPSGTIFTNSPTLTITTAAGAETGSSQCAYSTQKDIFENSVLFFNTDSSIHTQELLNLPEGPYNFFITCRDIAGNEAESQTTFTIEKDTSPPRITQLYKDSIALHLILNEDSNCEYSNSIFEFGQGTQMTGQNIKEHTASLQNSYYIICKDLYENSAQFNIYTTQ